jgi:VanZ family protein
VRLAPESASGETVLARGFIAVAVLAVLVATLTPMGGEKPHISLCIVCGERWASDILLNIVLYAPLGAALALGGWRSPWAVLGPALLSLSIEVAQVWIPGRDPSLGDVTFNTVGAALGVLLVRSSSLWVLPGRRFRRLLAVGSAAGAVLVLGATGALLEPAFPQSLYWGQWTPDLGNLALYRGRVLAASLGPRGLEEGRLDRSDRVRELLLARRPLAVHVIAGPRVTALAPLVSIADERSREIVLLGPDRDDLVFRYRTLAATVGLDEPDVRATGVMRTVVAGDSLRVAVRADGRGYCLDVNERAACGLGFTVGRGWALLSYPESLPPWLRALLDDAWVAALLIPLGFWIGGRWLAAALVGAVAVAMWVVPAATGLLSVSTGEAAGAVVGFGLGRVLQRLAAAPQRWQLAQRRKARQV